MSVIDQTDYSLITSEDAKEENDKFCSFVIRLARITYGDLWEHQLSAVYLAVRTLAKWYDPSKAGGTPLGAYLVWHLRRYGSRSDVDPRNRSRRALRTENRKREKLGLPPRPAHPREVVPQSPDPDRAPVVWQKLESREIDPQEEAEIAEGVKRFRQVIARLKPTQREAIERGVFQDINDGGEGKRLGVTHQAISHRRRTALNNLIQMMRCSSDTPISREPHPRQHRASSGRKAAP